MKSILSLCLLAVFATITVAQNNIGATISKENDPKMQWWNDAKFGMFIHWGLYSVPAGKWGDVTSHSEWIMFQAKIPRLEYSAFAEEFNPTLFNADKWVKLAKDAGQKYIVITSKHHEGFAMFKSEVSPYNIVDATPFKRDILKELAEACRKQEMKLGFYYSHSQDWYHPGGAVRRNVEWDESHKGDMNKYVDEIAMPQVNEILSKYGDVAVLWWDTPTNMTKGIAQKFTSLTIPYPYLITNNRLGAGMNGDFETPEKFIPAGYPGQNWEAGRDWEACMTMNGHWGYNAWDDRWKSTEELLRTLIDIVSKGGNLLLNVGPNAYGVIPEVCQQNLREMGDWLKLNGEAIYGTQASPFPFLSWGRVTRKEQTLYLHVFDWPEDGRLVMPFSNRISKAYLLADAKTRLAITPTKEISTIHLPAYAPDRIASVVAVEFIGEPDVLPVPSLGAKVNATSSAEICNPANLTDGDLKSKWEAAEGENAAMLDIDLGEPVTIQCMSLVEALHRYLKYPQTYDLLFFDGKEWTEVFNDFVTEGKGATRVFAPVTAQKFRLIVKNEKKPPFLSEVLLFRDD